MSAQSTRKSVSKSASKSAFAPSSAPAAEVIKSSDVGPMPEKIAAPAPAVKPEILTKVSTPTKRSSKFTPVKAGTIRGQAVVLGSQKDGCTLSDLDELFSRGAKSGGSLTPALRRRRTKEMLNIMSRDYGYVIEVTGENVTIKAPEAA